MAALREFKHCQYCRNGSMLFMCKRCEDFSQYVPRITKVQRKVIKMLIANPGVGLLDRMYFNFVEARTDPKSETEYKSVRLEEHDLLNIRRDTLQALIDREIIALEWGHDPNQPRFYKLNEKIKWRLK